ncbi:MAG TPA: hypothetical protein DEE98_08940 [Elusimicrobia bacterium]|nr:MAG: hypothetical protein A2386_05015 [Elusimicrobia bacterium RIFOXYB1_FULL_48_9]OGS15725.1 MAG: hypothetical protein A2251_08550 [Elusimicrobia bacterium RIFOXYA2_FULL_47_53]OGS27056.1 MAG: hypothetical protein A2339_01070 [Elusimicrobia bacterium RIFOXYB12_FULL_50_12]OGS31026.1 MAG: hypothetical protein A2323_06870 [Elusimicrobia bacterium RIFOXYB2_FULL_46_23]HBU70488.1 hypothetical protein [Elusimicrobiota bacterium]
MEKKKSILKWVGLGLVIFSLLFIPVIAYVPFMPLSLKQKGVLTAVLVIGGQALTWIGGLMLGKELLTHYRKYLNPRNWFKNK